MPVENPGGEPATLLLRIADGQTGSLNGKATVAPGSAGELALWIDAPAPRSMGMIAGPSRTAAGIEPHTVPVTATEGSVDTSRDHVRPPRDRAADRPAGTGHRPVSHHAAERGRQDRL